MFTLMLCAVQPMLVLAVTMAGVSRGLIQGGGTVPNDSNTARNSPDDAHWQNWDADGRVEWAEAVAVARVSADRIIVAMPFGFVVTDVSGHSPYRVVVQDFAISGAIGLDEEHVLVWNGIGGCRRYSVDGAHFETFEPLAGVLVEGATWSENELIVWGATANNPDEAAEILLSDHGVPVGATFSGCVFVLAEESRRAADGPIGVFPGSSVKAVARLASGELFVVLASGSCALLEKPDGRSEWLPKQWAEDRGVALPRAIWAGEAISVAQLGKDAVIVAGAEDDRTPLVYEYTFSSSKWRHVDSSAVVAKALSQRAALSVVQLGGTGAAVMVIAKGCGLVFASNNLWFDCEGLGAEAICSGVHRDGSVYLLMSDGRTSRISARR